MSNVTRDAKFKHRGHVIRFLFSLGYRTATGEPGMRSLMKIYKFLELNHMGGQLDLFAEFFNNNAKQNPVDAEKKLHEFSNLLLLQFFEFNRIVEDNCQVSYDVVNQYDKVSEQEHLIRTRAKYKHLVNHFFRDLGFPAPIHNLQKVDKSRKTKYEVLPKYVDRTHLNYEALRKKNIRAKVKAGLQVPAWLVTIIVAVSEGAVAMIFAGSVSLILKIAIFIAGTVINAILFKAAADMTFSPSISRVSSKMIKVKRRPQVKKSRRYSSRVLHLRVA